MAWTAEYTWVTGAVVKIRGRVFSVFQHANGREHVVLEDETGRLVTLPAANAVAALEYPSPTEMERFSASVERSIRCRERAAQVATILEAWAAFLPARVVNEDLGDYLEDIRRRACEGQRLGVYIRLVAALAWTAMNSVGYAMKQLGNTRAASQQVTIFNQVSVGTTAMPKNVVVFPVSCEHCGAKFDMECAHSSGFSYVSPGWFRCTSCQNVNELDLLMAEPLRLVPRGPA